MKCDALTRITGKVAESGSDRNFIIPTFTCRTGMLANSFLH